jgi:CheY-like chemotaxis protein
MAFRLSEAISNCVARVLPRVHAKELTFAFDFAGVEVFLATVHVPLECSLHRLMCALIDVMESGIVALDATATVDRLGECRLHIRAWGTGRLVDQRGISSVVERLLLHEHWLYRGDEASLRKASGVCPRTGAAVDFATIGTHEVTLIADAVFPVADVDDSPLPSASRARAWVIDSDQMGASVLGHRLQRLGWAVTSIGSVEEALRRLKSLETGWARPALVILVEVLSDVPAAIVLGQLLPEWTRKVLGVRLGSEALADDGEMSGFEVVTMPLSPAMLRRVTAEVSGAADAGSGCTNPAPLALEDRPSVLVVDDDAMNRLVETSMARALGYEADGVASGDEAVRRCVMNAPSLVLIDVSMPGMAGCQAARRWRALQTTGDVAPFAIVAATEFPERGVRAACLQAGMDSIIVKPVAVAALRSNLRRLVLLPTGPSNVS